MLWDTLGGSRTELQIPLVRHAYSPDHLKTFVVHPVFFVRSLWWGRLLCCPGSAYRITMAELCLVLGTRASEPPC